MFFYKPFSFLQFVVICFCSLIGSITYGQSINGESLKQTYRFKISETITAADSTVFGIQYATNEPCKPEDICACLGDWLYLELKSFRRFEVYTNYSEPSSLKYRCSNSIIIGTYRLRKSTNQIQLKFKRIKSYMPGWHFPNVVRTALPKTIINLTVQQNGKLAHILYQWIPVKI